MKTKTFISSKKLKTVLLSGLLILSLISLKSQTSTCYSDTTLVTYSRPPLTSCNTCASFDDYVPLNSDSILYVRLNFHYLMIKPSTPGFYKNADITTALASVSLINNLCYDSLHKPALRVYPTPAYIKRPKIKFVLKGVYKHYDSTAYFSAGVGNWTPLAAYETDTNAIDVIFKGDATNSYFGQSHGIPAKSVKLNWGGSNPLDTGYIWWQGTELIAHELAHALGLYHTNEVHSCLDDYLFETPTIYFAGGGACNASIDSTHSNNLMNNNNYNCSYYMSPRQLATCHKNLRHTFLFNTLTPSCQQIVRNTQSNANIDITSNQAWNIDRFMKGNITVKANKTLTITCRLAMTKNAKITVEKTAALVVNGGTITNISGNVWDGIYVQGDIYNSQVLNPGNVNYALYQGWAKLYNATISHAKIGIRNHNDPWLEYGGIISAYTSNFLDNYIDVQQIGSNSSASYLASASRFYNCVFKSVGIVGDGLYPVRHVNLYRSIGAGFYSCRFECGSGATINGNNGIGIYSANSSYNVGKIGSSPSVFTNLWYGVAVNNYIPFRVPTITNTLFDANSSYAGYFLDAYYLSFQTNTVQANASYPEGIYLNQCKYYKIKNNLFTKAGGTAAMGLEIYKSGAGAHEVYRNTFSNQYVGINIMDDNGNSLDGVKMNCNVFNQTANNFDIAMTYTSGSNPPSVLAVQGLTASASYSTVVRNIYGATCVTGQQNKWYVHSSCTQNIDHGANTNSTTAVTQPSSTCKSGNVKVVNSGISLNYTSHCPGNPLSSGGTGTTQAQRLSNMNDYLSALKASNTDDVNHFEIQSTVASKLNEFLTDTLGPQMDSVINILENNHGEMEDADIQTVFAYLAKGEYTAAQTKVDNLAESRADWADLLTKVIAVEQYTTDNGIYELNSNSTDRNFLIGYATSTTGIDGQSIAQAILKHACDSNYTEPHSLPDVGGGRFANPEGVSSFDPHVDRIDVFPNPTSNGLNIQYFSNSDDNVTAELKDLLGRTIYTNFISKSGDLYIPMAELSGGIYLLIITRNKEVIHTEKIIKEQ